MKRIILSAIAMVLCALSSFAYGTKIDGIYYNFHHNTSGGVRSVEVTYEAISYCNSYSGFVNIPSSIKHMVTYYTVTSIGRYAFHDCSGLTNVWIPNSVRSIEERAFYNCTGLKSVEIPNTVTYIEEGAFENCSGLTSVTIPNSMTSIADYMFSGCSSLTSIDIPNSVTSIGKHAFSGCSSLTSVTIPESVMNIGDAAFLGCSKLTSINIESSHPKYTTIDGILYKRRRTILVCCPEGKTGEVTIPNSVTSIEDYAFYDCIGLKSIICNAKVPPTCGSNTFGCSNYSYFPATLYVPKGSGDSYRNAEGWKNFNNIVEMEMDMDMEEDDNTTAVEGLAAEAFSAYAAGGTVYCSAEEFQIFNVQGKNVTSQNGALPAGVYVVAAKEGRAKVIVK